MQKKFSDRPFLYLLPFLFLYILIILFRSSAVPFGDEGRYLQFAENLLHGFYSPPPPDINLWNGPGFPLYLLPFVAFGVPLTAIKLCNAFLYFASLLLVNKTLRRFLNPWHSFLVTAVAGFYYMPYKSLPHILSETVTIFLISLIAFVATAYFSSDKKNRNVPLFTWLSILLAFLALTKVVFGPVYLFTAAAFLILYLFRRKNVHKQASWLLAAALLLCSPYLIYTYSLTGKIFYWSNAGGMSLYWMSTPADGEWGEWYNDSLITASANPEAQQKLQANHRVEYGEIHQYTGLVRDDKFKEYALRNIQEHPGKYVLNWMANWSRMFFNYPVSYTPLRLGAILNMLINIPVLILLVYSAILTRRRKTHIPFALVFLLVISGVYLVGSSFLSAYDRMFYILMPVLAWWIGFTFFGLAGEKSELQKSK